MAMSCELIKTSRDVYPNRRETKALTPRSWQPLSMGRMGRLTHKLRKPGQSQSFWPHAQIASSGPLRGRPSVKAQASPYTPFAWEPSDYHKIKFCPQPIGPIVSTNTDGSAVLMFYREGDPPNQPTTQCLEVFIAGDTSKGIFNVCAGIRPERPAVTDLLWSILERGQDISKRDWKIIRVAIVDVKEDAFIGRLFFGDPETGKVVWDCDCRPSDGCWLSLKSGAPLFVHKKVWSSIAKPLDSTFAYEEHRKGQQGTPPQPAAQKQKKDSTALNGTQEGGFWTVLPSDPDVIKLLKRELEVALKEEDYPGAIKIRDHPYMKLYAQVFHNRQQGDGVRAAALEDELARLIKDAERSSQASPDK